MSSISRRTLTSLACRPAEFTMCATVRLHTRLCCQSVVEDGKQRVDTKHLHGLINWSRVTMAGVILRWNISETGLSRTYVLISRYRTSLPLFSLHPLTLWNCRLRPTCMTEKQTEPHVGQSVHTWCRFNLSCFLKKRFVHRCHSDESRGTWVQLPDSFIKNGGEAWAEELLLYR